MSDPQPCYFETQNLTFTTQLKELCTFYIFWVRLFQKKYNLRFLKILIVVSNV